MVVSSVIALMSSSLSIPIALMTIFHFLIIRPSGWGWVNDYEADVDYPLIVIISSMSGYIIARMLSLKGVYETVYIGDAFDRILGSDKLPRRIMRVLKMFIMLTLLTCAFLPYELASLTWGPFITCGILVILPFVYWLMFRGWAIPIVSVRTENHVVVNDIVMMPPNISAISMVFHDSLYFEALLPEGSKQLKVAYVCRVGEAILWFCILIGVPTIIMWMVELYAADYVFWAAFGVSTGLSLVAVVFGTVVNFHNFMAML